jgi:hypothetical protein
VAVSVYGPISTRRRFRGCEREDRFGRRPEREDDTSSSTGD